MTEDQRLLLKAIARLLAYPDAAWFEDLEPLREALDELPSTKAKRTLVQIVDDFQRLPSMHLREEYTRVFDLNPVTCLHLSHHKYGESKDRNAALVRLKQLYREAGLAISGQELPDYLPMMMEFLAVCPAESFSVIVNDYLDELTGLAARLEAAESAYARLVLIVPEILTGVPT